MISEFGDSKADKKATGKGRIKGTHLIPQRDGVARVNCGASFETRDINGVKYRHEKGRNPQPGMGKRQSGAQFHNGHGPGSQKQENKAHSYQQVTP